LLVIIISGPIACTPKDPFNANSSLRTDSSNYVSDPKPIGLYPVDLRHSLHREIHYLDVIGDSAMDTLVLKREVGQTVIGMFDKGVVHDLLSVSPLFATMPEYLATTPPIERIYLEANGVRSSDKGLRLIIRNTDMDLEYSFFDIKLEGDDVLIGLCGMYDLGEMTGNGSLGKERLCTAIYDRHLESDANGDREIDPLAILSIFWGNLQDCQCQ